MFFCEAKLFQSGMAVELDDPWDHMCSAQSFAPGARQTWAHSCGFKPLEAGVKWLKGAGISQV